MLHLFEFEGLFACDRAIVLASNQTTAEQLLHASSPTFANTWRKVWCHGTVDADDPTQRILLLVDLADLDAGKVEVRDDQGPVELPDFEVLR